VAAWAAEQGRIKIQSRNLSLKKSDQTRSTEALLIIKEKEEQAIGKRLKRVHHLRGSVARNGSEDTAMRKGPRGRAPQKSPQAKKCEAKKKQFAQKEIEEVEKEET